MDSSLAVWIFAQPPKPGSVKTRLVRSWGEQPAADPARTSLLDTLSLSWQGRAERTEDPDQNGLVQVTSSRSE